MAESLKEAGPVFVFELVYGWNYATEVLDHIKTSNRQGLAEVYKLALIDPQACGILQAKRPEDGTLVGTVVLYNMQSRLSEFVPAMKDTNELTGGISSPVISPAVGEYSTLLQGLILLGMRQIKKQGCNACVLDYVSHVTCSTATLSTDGSCRWTETENSTACLQWASMSCTASKRSAAMRRHGPECHLRRVPPS